MMGKVDIVMYVPRQNTCGNGIVTATRPGVCQVYGCKNKPNYCKGKSFLKILDLTNNPEVKDQAVKWLRFIRTSHSLDKFRSGRHEVLVVCKDHFLTDSFIW